MARKRVIVGIGEALLAETQDGEQPAGIALLVPIHAARLGHEGIAISRLGQDEPGTILLAKLRELGVETSHLQSDPDLATGRIVVRALDGVTRLDAHAAYDNLQWDFDLDDVAQRADAVVFGVRCRRSGQSRSTIDRFLEECLAAIRVFDLAGHARAELGNRNDLLSGARHAGVLVVDDEAVQALLPGASAAGSRETLLELLRGHDASLVVRTEPGGNLEAHTAESSWTSELAYRRELHEPMLVALLHGLLSGWDAGVSVAVADRVGRFTADHPGEAASPELLERP